MDSQRNIGGLSLEFDFSRLQEMQREIAALRVRHAESLLHYHNNDLCGFWHRYNEKDPAKFSKASTSTCVLSLVATGLWSSEYPWFSKTTALVDQLLHVRDWTSAKLPKDNPFTVSFLAEALLALQSVCPNEVSTNPGAAGQLIWAAGRLNTILLQDEGDIALGKARPDDPEFQGAVRGAAHITPYPPTTFLTQLVVRVLLKLKPAAAGLPQGSLTPDAARDVRIWAWHRIEHELSLFFSDSNAADAFSLAYAVILFVSISKIAETSPAERQILTRAIDCVFQAQLDDGSWPRSRPLFHYQDFGNAYCYEFEMLTQFLQCKELVDDFIRHLPELNRALVHLKSNALRLGDRGIGWASNHHPQLPGPESWSTASAYHFLHELERLLAEAIRRSVFRYAEAPYSAPEVSCTDDAKFAPPERFLDANLLVPGAEKPESLRKTIFDRFVLPIAQASELLRNGRSLPKDRPMSMLMFGPPGTSKTDMAEYVAEYLGWPLLSIDPSHLIRDGWNRIHAETNSLFNRLAAIDQAVVFLDEFDEMVRERLEKGSQPLSRFFTTAMLPKLTRINKQRRIVLLVATNHVEAFDAAILRRGRFDAVVQVMPPTTDEKLRKWANVQNALHRHAIELDDVLTKKLGALTFAEFKEHAGEFAAATSAQEMLRQIDAAFDNCTLQSPISEGEARTWAAVSEEHARKYIRLPRVAGK